VDKASWVEVSFQIPSEQVEAVAEVLGRFTQGGVAIEQIVEENNQTSAESRNNYVHVFGYFFSDKTFEEKKKHLEESLFYLSKIQPIPAPEYKLIYDQDWMTSWKNHYHPLTVGKKLAILPAWAENVFPDRIPIRINPGLAFGSGTHPTTQLCLEIMERVVPDKQQIFDIGCGSGILSIAAVKLGAAHAYGVDISPAAIASSKENAQKNRILEKVDFQQGSITEISNGCFEILQAPLVIVNILFSVILRLFDDGLADLVEADGLLILSGILTPQVAKITAKAQSCGFKLSEKFEIEDWAALSLIKCF